MMLDLSVPGTLYVKLYWSIVMLIRGVYLWLLGATATELYWTDTSVGCRI